MVLNLAMRRSALVLLFLMNFILIHGQNPELDSLRNSLKLQQSDTSRINTLNELGWQILPDDQSAALSYVNEALAKSIRSRFLKGEANAYVTMAVAASMNAAYDSALYYYQKALTIRQKIKDLKGIANIYNNLGNVFDEKGDFFKAIENYQQAFNIQQQRKDTVKMGRAQYNISTLYWRMGNYPKAIENVYAYLAIVDKLNDKEGIGRAYNQLGNIHVDILKQDKAMVFYQKSLKIWHETGDLEEQANILNNIGCLNDDQGETSMDNNDYEKAFKFFEEALRNLGSSLKIRTDRKDERGKGEVFNNIGVVYKNLGTLYERTGNAEKSKQSLNQALASFNLSLKIRENEDDKKGIIEVYNGIGDVYRRQKNYSKALFYALSYQKLADEIGDTKFQQKAFKDLSSLYAATGDYKKAYNLRLKYEDLKDQRMNESNLLKYQQDEFNFKEGQKQRELDKKQSEIALQQEKLKSERTMRNSLLGGAILLSLLAMLLFNRNRIKTRSNKELTEKNIIIEQERKRSDDLLLNILPESTAHELKTSGSAKARKYEFVSVLFTDFKNFTQIAEKLSAEELVAELDACFKGFDEITEKYNIEKIKTIGDAYMCAGGIPDANNTHPADTVQAGLEMIEFLKSYQKPKIEKGLPYFEVRIGIHTGPVVAGVVGSRKFAYDIWGDTVNLAARMESSGAPGKVNISETTYQAVKEQFNCSHRGMIEAKNKGEIDMYFVDGLKNV